MIRLPPISGRSGAIGCFGHQDPGPPAVPARFSAALIRTSGSASVSSPSSSCSASSGGYPRLISPSLAKRTGGTGSRLGDLAAGGFRFGGDPVLEFEDDPFRSAFADSGHGLEAFGVPADDRRNQFPVWPAGKRRDRDLGSDAADPDQLGEEIALLLGGEAVEGDAVIPADRLRVEEDLGAGSGHAAKGLAADPQAIADSGCLHHDVVAPANQNLASDRGDQLATRIGAGAASAAASRSPAVPPWQIATARASAA